MRHTTNGGDGQAELEAAVKKTKATKNWMSSSERGGKGNENAWAMRSSLDNTLRAIGEAKAAGRAGGGPRAVWTKLRSVSWDVV